jgi:excinuclease ABC subunit B
MYADEVTDSMQAAIDETAKRRAIQIKYNQEHGITPKTIKKPIRNLISVTKDSDDTGEKDDFVESDFEQMAKKDQKNMLARLTEEMRDAAKKLDFEQAATLRDTIIELKGEMS